jgi:sialidase-1
VPALAAPVVQCSVTYVSGLGLVSAGPGDPTQRRALTLRVSPDEGHSWRPWRLVWPGPAAYSDLLDLGDEIGVLYGAGSEGPYERIDFARVPLQPDERAVLPR